jgi:hypothetical protein
MLEVKPHHGRQEADQMATQHQHKPWEGVVIPDEMRSEVSYPVVQWINQPFRLRPPQENGGFFVARKYGGVELPESIEAQYHDDPGTFATHLAACLLAMRVAWVRKEAGAEIRLSGYENGARKRAELLMLLQAEESSDVVGPVRLTTLGTANKELTVKYQALAATAKAVGAEPWMFWVDLEAGETQQVGDHNVTMTPIAVDIPEADVLDAAFVGSDVLENAVFPLSDDLAEWRHAWNGDDIGEHAFEGDVEGVDDVQANAVLAAAVKTQQHGKTSFEALLQNDRDYARKVADHISGNPAGFNEGTVAAALTVLEMLDEEEADEEEIPF